MNEHNGTLLIQQLHDWVEGWIAEVDTVVIRLDCDAIGVERVRVKRELDFFQRPLYIREGCRGEVSDPRGLASLKLGRCNVTFAGDSARKFVVTVDKVRAWRRDAQVCLGYVQRVHHSEVVFFRPCWHSEDTVWPALAVCDAVLAVLLWYIVGMDVDFVDEFHIGRGGGLLSKAMRDLPPVCERLKFGLCNPVRKDQHRGISLVTNALSLRSPYSVQ